MVAAPIAATEAGQEYKWLPPHVTIFPWFDMETAQWQKFDQAMHDIVQDTVQPTVQGGDAALFGQQETEPARRLNRATSTFNIIQGFDIHAGVYRAVRRRGGDYDPSYVGLKWNPHISNSDSFALKEDETLALPELAVFQRRTADGMKMVQAVYKWETAQV